MLKAGKLMPAVAQAALDTVERRRTEVSGASRREHKAIADVVCLLPQAARVYRDATRNLNATLIEPEDRAEARALIGDLVGGRVVIRQEGEAVYAQLNMDAAVLLSAAANSGKFNDFKCGSGGVLWTNSIIPLFAQKRSSDKVLRPTRCGNGHELTPDNLVTAERGTRWRCRQCGADRAAEWRRRHPTAA